MVPMISSVLKPAVTRLIEPVAGFALRIGLTPNMVTMIGAVGVLASAGYFYPREDYFIGTLFICFFALSDLFEILIPLIAADDKLSYLGLVTLVTGLLIPYIRAKAESFGIDCSVGIAERTERLIIILTAVGFEGLNVPYALATGLWILAILGVITVVQRIKVVRDGLLT